MKLRPSIKGGFLLGRNGKKMKDKIAKLINVKSIVTLVLTCVFSFLAIKGIVEGREFLNIFTTIIVFYFGTQYQKNMDKEG